MDEENAKSQNKQAPKQEVKGPAQPSKTEEHKEDKDKRSAHIDPEVLKSINETILDSSPGVTWDDVKGLNDVKKILQE